MIRVCNIIFSYGSDRVFDDASFVVGKGQKIGLVGPNGAGKSTLFKILRGDEQISGGTIDISGKIGFVPQEVKHDPELENSPSARVYLRDGKNLSDFELKRMLSGLELSNLNLDLDCKRLSGGQKTKLALARALLSHPDILLLDEPTNFMDIAGKKFVMNFLADYHGTLILISHDLSLLDKSIDKVLYIDIQNRKIDEYSGNYTKFLKLKKEKEETAKRHILAEKKHIESMKEGLKKLYKHQSGKGVRQRVQLEKRIEKLEAALPPLPKELEKIHLDLPIPSRVGELPIRILDVSKSYGDLKVLNGVNFSIRRGERFVLIGPNGAGKSTLLKILVGVLKLDKGEVVRDYNLKLGYYSQEFETFDFNQVVFDLISEKSKLSETKVRSFLARFLFKGESAFQKIGSLSGGEKTRLAIALLVLQDFNLLILDEPTTYLDPMSQRIILEALKGYKGTMIVVSHTEDFIKELNPTRALALPENKLSLWSEDLLREVSRI